MTTANKITVLRILLIPVFVVEAMYYGKTGNELHRWIALACFGTASFCDAVDGYVARHFNQRSELGTILDPLADKLLLTSAIILLSFDHQPYFNAIPIWLTGTIIGRDVLVVAGIIVLYMTVGKAAIQPRMLGKTATVLQMIVVLWILLKWRAPWLRPLTLAAGLCTGISGLFYVWDWMRQLGTHPASSPTVPAADSKAAK